MQTVLVYNEMLNGHMLEYFHHLYEGAIDHPEKKFYFAYPESEEEMLSKLEWPQSDNIEFYRVSDAVLLKNNNYISKIIVRNKLLRDTCKSLSPDRVILNNVIAFMPFLPFFKSIKHVSGIIYGIYLYDWRGMGIIKRFYTICNYLLFSRSRSFDNVFIQGDKASAHFLNKLYKTDVFKYICDPVVLIKSESQIDVREKYKIPKDKKIVLHAGVMSSRKGTFQLLHAIELAPKDILDQYAFIFVGKVLDSAKENFYSIVEKEKLRATTVVIDEFVDFDFLGAMFKQCDLVLAPYLLTNQTSGIVGYSAEYNKPIVVNNTGLLMKIVRKYGLGYILPHSSSEDIVDLLASITKEQINGEYYLSNNTVKEFNNTFIR